MRKSEEYVGKVHASKMVDPNNRRRLLGRWKDKVKEYMCERGTIRRKFEQARRKCLDRERWRSQSSRKI